MSRGPGKNTKHHRKPKSLGGKDVVVVKRREHEAWHCLFANLSAPEILLRFLYFYRLFAAGAIFAEPEVTPWCTYEQLKAWIILFGNMEIEDMIVVINTTWIDLDFELFVVYIEGAAKIGIKKVVRKKKQVKAKKRR